MRVYEDIKNTGIAVGIDCGEFNEIHPKDKEVIADRLAKQALFLVYHLVEKKDAFGPIYEMSYSDGNSLIITLNYEGTISKPSAPRHRPCWMPSM